MKKLTVGSLVYDDFDGIYFSYQSLRLNNLDILEQLDLVVIDNNPNSPEGEATKDFCGKAHIRYIPEESKKSTSLRNKVFENAEAPYTVCMDPHVMFEPLTLKYLLAFYQKNPNAKDLYQGPMFMDCIKGHDPMTHMDPVWRGHMWGTWGVDKRGVNANQTPFVIPMHGLGMFSCKTDEWLGFNEDFIGFGGEEGYIHEKYRKNERQCWCLPFFRWLHRFGRPRGVPYPLQLEHRIFNYVIGFKELGLKFDPIIDHFGKESPSVDVRAIINDPEAAKRKYHQTNGLKNPDDVPGLPKFDIDTVLKENDIVLDLPE